MKIVKIIDVEPLHDFVVKLEFSDGLIKETDLDVYLHGGVFEPIRNSPELFRSVRVAEGERTISWPNGVDIDPYTLYYGLNPAWNEEDDALLAALEQRRNRVSFVAPEMSRPEIEIR